MMDRIYFCAYILLFFVPLAYSQDPIISSTLGEIVGKSINVRLDGLPDREVHTYLGIPFAKPPVGDLRFRKPEPMTSLPSPFLAHTYGAICPQQAWNAEVALLTQNEDCLFLDVYVPDMSKSNSQNGLAVMVWIYGGSFNAGASRFYNGSALAATGNIIVVTINYRLGVFGFLSTGDKENPGNFGLWDQRMALQWVHDNIGDFGGDKQKVTIAGESAGAMSVIQHALTPTNYGLFQRVIAESGSMSSPILALDRDGSMDTNKVADILGCTDDPMENRINCFRTKSTEEFLPVFQNMPENFSPLVDDDFIKFNTMNIAAMSDSRYLEEIEFFRSLDILSGFNAFEGAFMLPYVMNPTQVENIKPSREELKTQYLPTLMRFLFYKDYADEIMTLVEAQYTNWTNPDDYNSIRLQIAKLLGDGSFCIPAVEMARLHKKSSASRNFMYHFAPKPSVSEIVTPSWIPGATHADELLFVFGEIGRIGVGMDNAWEKELSMRMMTYWTNFIKTGDPNSPEPVSPSWPEYNMETGDYLVLDKSMSEASAKQHFYAEEANFWLEVFPDLVEAVHADNGGSCGEGTLKSDAPNLTVCGTVLLALAVFLSSVSLI